MDNNELIEMYKEYEAQLADFFVPLILTNPTERVTKILDPDTGKLAGFLCTSGDYISDLYIAPPFRRKGLGSAAVLKWYKEPHDSPSLRIINNNYPALAFWRKLFILDAMEDNGVDTFYNIVSLQNNTTITR